MVNSSLGLAQGGRDAGDPLHLCLRQLLEVGLTIQRTIGHHVGRSIDGVELVKMTVDDLAKLLAIMPIATSGCISRGMPAWCSTISASMT